MKDEKKTKAQLILELNEMREKINRLTALEIRNKETEKALEFERKRLFAVLEAIPVWVYLQAPDYSIRWGNSKFYKLFGDPKGRPCYEALQGRKKPCEPCPTFTVFETKTLQEWEWTSDDGQTHLKIYDNYFLDNDGSPLVLEMGVDITNQKNTEKKLEQVNKQLESAVEKAEAATKLKEEFLAIMSHEIKTPLSGIIGFSDLILKNLTSEKTSINLEKQLKYITLVSKSSHRLNELLNNLLALSRLESGKKQKIVFKEFNVRSMINDIFILLSDRIKTNENKTSVKIIGNETFYCDQFRLQQILFNLIGNALKFTRNGLIEVVIKEDENKYYFEVKDTGIGIPKEKFDEVFDVFTQVDNRLTLRSYQGVGLGLSVVKRMINELDGKIGLESKLNKGSVFFFELPKMEYISDFIILKKNEPKGYKLKECKVLFADDDLISYNLIESSLNAIGAGKIKGYFDGLKLLNEFKRNNDYDVILLDIQIPEMDGVECMKRIKEINNNIPVIALTAFALHDDKDKFLNLGFDEYLGKPFNYKELYGILSKVFEKSKN